MYLDKKRIHNRFRLPQNLNMVFKYDSLENPLTMRQVTE